MRDIHRRVSRRLTGFLSNGKSADRVAAEIIQMVAASCDTHPEGGDVQQAPSLMGSAVPSETSADAQEQPLEPKD